MGIKERHEREREAVRRAILDSARDLFVAEGYHNVSIRKIAERIEYSPAAIYKYFPSKDDIFYALAEEGFRLLEEVTPAPPATRSMPDDGLASVRGIFWHLYEFSRKHPEYFLLMFVDRTVPRISREYERFAFAREMRARMVGVIQRMVDTGVLPASLNAIAAFHVLTMGLLGVAVMQLSGRLPSSASARLIAGDVLEVTLGGLKSGVSLTATVLDLACAQSDGHDLAVGARVG